jgi:hypothetical protein
MCTHASYSPSYTLSPLPSPPTGTNPPPGRTHSDRLFSFNFLRDLLVFKLLQFWYDLVNFKCPVRRHFMTPWKFTFSTHCFPLNMMTEF